MTDWKKTMTDRIHTIAALAVELGARLTNPAPVIRVPYGVDPRCAELRERGDELAARLLEAEWRERVQRNEQRRAG